MNVAITKELLALIQKFELDALGFVYSRSYGTVSSTHSFSHPVGSYMVWLDTSPSRTHSVVSDKERADPLLPTPRFKSRRKLLRLLAEAGCPEAVSMYREKKITKLLT